MKIAPFGRFLGVGGLCFALNLLVLWLGTRVLGIHYLGAVVISALVCGVVGFALNRVWTFEARGDFWPQLGRYLVVNAGAFALNIALTALLVSGLGVPVLLASSGLAIALAALNFVLHGKWSFKTRKRGAY